MLLVNLAYLARVLRRVENLLGAVIFIGCGEDTGAGDLTHLRFTIETELRPTAFSLLSGREDKDVGVAGEGQRLLIQFVVRLGCQHGQTHAALVVALLLVLGRLGRKLIEVEVGRLRCQRAIVLCH